MNTTHYVHTSLRSWARGLRPLEAAVELLIRTGNASLDRAWVRFDETSASYWVDFDDIVDHLATKSGGERRLLTIAASLGSARVTVSLSDAIPSLDRTMLKLAMAAVAHAAGQHEPSSVVSIAEDGSLLTTTAEGLFPWP
jgi:hypothetical protein